MKYQSPLFSLLTVFFISLFPAYLSAQVCTGPITLTTQAQVDAFNCTSVTGGLTIQGAGITNLDGLSELTSTTNTFTINCPALLNINGLSNLTTVNKLTIRGCNALTNIDGLSGLTTAESHVIIGFNGSLTNVDGLSGLNSAGGNLQFFQNGSLANLDGLSNITSIGGWLEIGQSALTNLDALSSLTSVGAMTIRDNNLLTNLDGLSSLNSIGGFLDVRENDVLSSFCGLYRVMKSGGPGGTYTVNTNAVNPTQANIINGGPCAGVPVPTLSEWGLILMGLIMLAFGVMAVEQPRRALSVANLRNMDLRLLMLCWAGMMMLAVTAFGIATFATGYAPTLADVFCTPLAAGIVAFIAARVMAVPAKVLG